MPVRRSLNLCVGQDRGQPTFKPSETRARSSIMETSERQNRNLIEAQAYRSDATIPGSEFPRAVYVSVIAAFAWMLAACWLAFGTNGGGTGLDLVMVTVLFAVFLG